MTAGISAESGRQALRAVGEGLPDIPARSWSYGRGRPIAQFRALREELAAGWPQFCEAFLLMYCATGHLIFSMTGISVLQASKPS
jgi:hypothetical protein